MRTRRPSICSSHCASRCQPATLTTPTSDPTGFNDIDNNGMSTSNGHSQVKPLPHLHLGSNSNLAATAVAKSPLISVPRSHHSPEYDFADEEILPSPFLKVDKVVVAKDSAAAAASSSSNPSNMLVTSGPSSSSKGL